MYRYTKYTYFYLRGELESLRYRSYFIVVQGAAKNIHSFHLVSFLGSFYAVGTNFQQIQLLFI